MIERNFAGLDGFHWFMGIVESRQDPLFIGRVKVRVYAIHSASLSDIPSDDLPWAQVAQAANDDKPPIIKEGDVVIGFFADGRSAQIPIIMFKLPGLQSLQPNGQGFSDQRKTADLQNAPRKPVSRTYNTDGSGIVVQNPSTANTYPLPESIDKPTLSGVTRYDIANTVIQARKNNIVKGINTATGLTWNEPYPAYNPLYPYNHATETESGHVIEFDDTPGSERLSFTHRTGSFLEFYPSGSLVKKITKSNYTIVMGDDYVNIMGRALVTVGEGVYIKALGNVNIEADNNMNIQVAANLNISVGGDFNIKSQDYNLDVAKVATVVTGQSQFMTSKGDVHINASRGNYITSTSETDILSTGTINIQGSDVNMEISATAAQTGSATGLAPAPSPATPNAGQAGIEPVPVPFIQNFSALDSYTGSAYKQGLLLNADGTTPDANVSNTSCNFDPNVHTFFTSDQWTISTNGLNSIKQREGLGNLLPSGLIQAYQDPPGTNSYSIGYGTSGSVIPISLISTTTITKDQAEQYLLNAINNIFLPRLKEYITVTLTQNMVDALLSFMFNVGAGNFSKSSVRKFTNQQQWCSAANSFLLWNKSNGKVLPGLTGRRQAESTQYLS